MESLTPTVSFDIFMDDSFTSFRLFTHLGVKNIRATSVLNKIDYTNAHCLGQAASKNGHFEQRTSSRKVVKF